MDGFREYDPLRDPNPEEWLSTSERDRLLAVEEYHHTLEEEMPDVTLHASIHVTVENQIALGDEIPVAATLRRLMRQGLDRHDAVHAIGSVLAAYMFKAVREAPPEEDPSLAYYHDLEQLTPATWRRGIEDAS